MPEDQRREGDRSEERSPALGKAIDLLSRRALTRTELRQRLRRRQFSDDEIDAAIAWLEEKRLYPTDLEIIRDHASLKAARGGIGRFRLAYDLARRGIDRDDAEAIAGDLISDDDELAAARRELERIVGPVEQSAPRGRLPEKLVRRAIGRLSRRGFPRSVIRRAFDELSVSDPNLGDDD